MQILIEIPKSEIPKQQDVIEIPLHFIDGNVCEAGGYGFYVLPKGHGRLGDLDALEKEIEDYSEGAFAMKPEFLVTHASTIIEADKTESEDKE